MIIDANAKKPSELYHLMVQMIVPRPIAWILTENDGGGLNLAPFSYFNGVSSDPPIISISVGKKKTGDKKDTWRNIERTEKFVVHIPSISDAMTVTQSADELKYGDSEVDHCTLAVEQVEGWDLPRLKKAAIAMNCSLYKIVEVGNKPQALILGQIQSIWLDPNKVETQGPKITISPHDLDPLGRLGRSSYAKIKPLEV